MEQSDEPCNLRVVESTPYGDDSRAPLLSVLLISPIGFETLRGTWRALQQQTVREQLEIVLVTSGPAELEQAHWQPFLRVVHLKTDDIGCMGEAAAAGVRASSAAIVARTEDHCFPRRDWAERFVEAFRETDVAGVGPTVHSANPGSVMSDVNYTLEYAWAGPDRPKGPAPFIPGHNSGYRRDVLLSLGDDLGWWLESETVMHWELARRGHHFAMAAGPETDHWNPSRFVPSLVFVWTYPRVFAARRQRLLSSGERWKMRVLWPAIPLARFRSLWTAGRARFGATRMLRLAPVMALLLLVAAWSEALGYWFGATPALLRGCLDREMDRGRFLRSGEKVEFRPSE